MYVVSHIVWQKIRATQRRRNFRKIVRGQAAKTFSSRSEFFRSKASQNSLASGDDDAKLARLRTQFRGRDDAKKKEQDGKRKDRSETRRNGERRDGTRERKKEEGYIGRNIYEESSSMHPHPKVGSWLSPPLCARMYVRVHVCMCVCTLRNMCARMCTYTCVWNETWQRRLECSLGTHESPTRRARPSFASHSATSYPLPLASSPRYRKKRGPREMMGLPGRNSLEFPERIFSPFLHARILSSPSLVLLYTRAALFADFSSSGGKLFAPSIHLCIHLYIHAVLITKRKSRRRIKVTSLCCKRVIGCIPIRSKVRILHF